MQTADTKISAINEEKVQKQKNFIQCYKDIRKQTGHFYYNKPPFLNLTIILKEH